ncbi:cobyrinic acid a,c-diamide synthase [Amycolatopsis xylanica]|uniref:Hydrogenobyrinate a,c-diamide synthase n=1 Tax=Amycolatopsis xylanica TaxID=589385 RepID=A0A1H2W1H4_9PSEU|nr:cobyrinate a,c-diamide synthase [Amycolatopsis xylanica]SDW74468.1 cobyrinic acid a,c-diamide synthase [Amycolatopsis xylanica]
MTAVPRVVIAAPASGQGKTTIATGLIAALSARGLTVSPHKVGPDYIDPGYHGIAAGRPGRNLDPFLVGEERIVPMFLHGVRTPRQADVAVVEGVMGLFDGMAAQPEFASTAHVAKLLRAPVILVVDGSSQGASVAALVSGFRDFDEHVRLGGVILNRVASDRHEAMLTAALKDIGMPVLGVVRRRAEIATPSRHLGLVPVAERAAPALETVRTLSELITESVDLDAVLALANTAPPLPGPAWDPAEAIGSPLPGRPRIAVAGGEAFTFSYAETAELLTACGAEVVPLDPIHDPALPAGTSGLVIGGGFPEVHAQRLAGNAELRADVRRLAREGGAIAAECAGLLYLAKSLDGHPMCGLIPTEAEMHPRLTLGYRRAVAVTDSCLAEAGTTVHGHEFHRTVCTPAAGERPAWNRAGHGPEGFVDGAIHASYLHTHWAGNPAGVRRFVEACG